MYASHELNYLVASSSQISFLSRPYCSRREGASFYHGISLHTIIADRETKTLENLLGFLSTPLFFQASEARSCTCSSALAASLPSTPPSHPIISVNKSWKTVEFNEYT